jgi:hypothetical protein
LIFLSNDLNFFIDRYPMTLLLRLYREVHIDKGNVNLEGDWLTADWKKKNAFGMKISLLICHGKIPCGIRILARYSLKFFLECYILFFYSNKSIPR